MKKLKKNNKKQDKNYERKVKIGVKGIKQLSAPLSGKFLSLVIKNYIVNGDKEE